VAEVVGVVVVVGGCFFYVLIEILYVKKSKNIVVRFLFIAWNFLIINKTLSLS
jgi:hypothetical protein